MRLFLIFLLEHINSDSINCIIFKIRRYCIIIFIITDCVFQICKNRKNIKYASIHPRSITALEVEQGAISLVKWSVKVREDSVMYIGREILDGPTPLEKFWE